MNRGRGAGALGNVDSDEEDEPWANRQLALRRTGRSVVDIYFLAFMTKPPALVRVVRLYGESADRPSGRERQ